ncbi:MAG: hypothetical protein VXZ67_10890 [Pseudomonadota bacterium]|nr:hypothetical protein [Pseudomonadota bacterium]
MTKDSPPLFPVAGTARPLAGHAAILPELTEWARKQAPDGPLQPDQLAAILAHSRHLQTLARTHPDLLAIVPAGGGAAAVRHTIEVCEAQAVTLASEPQMKAAQRAVCRPCRHGRM